MRIHVDGLSLFARPIPIAAVLLMITNDHWLKAQFPGFLTGKISDFCGVFFLPLFLGALFTLFFRKDFGAKLLLLFIVATDLIFMGVKFSPAVQFEYLKFQSAIGLPAIVTLDLTDLWALLMNPVTWLYVQRARYSSTIMVQV
jgi:hypothetical protein